jgi:hypothetical protein
MDPAATVPSFVAGISLWAVALALISIPPLFPLIVRLLGVVAAVLFGVTALRIFAGAPLMPMATPLPFYAYPVLVATLAGWIWRLLKTDAE